MNLDLILEIADLAVTLVENASHGSQTAAAVTDALVQILQKGAQAYQQHAGLVLDPSLIRPEATV